MPSRIMRLAAIAATIGTALAAATSAPAAVQGFQLGFTDFGAFENATGVERQTALQHAKDSGASIIRLGMDWDAASKTKPPSLGVERDPSWAGYNWSDTDSTIRDAAATGSPPWARSATHPRGPRGRAARRSRSSTPPAPGARPCPITAPSRRPPPSATRAPIRTQP